MLQVKQLSIEIPLFWVWRPQLWMFAKVLKFFCPRKMPFTRELFSNHEYKFIIIVLCKPKLSQKMDFFHWDVVNDKLPINSSQLENDHEYVSYYYTCFVAHFHFWLVTGCFQNSGFFSFPMSAYVGEKIRIWSTICVHFKCDMGNCTKWQFWHN